MYKTDTPVSLKTFSLWQGGGWSLSAACVAWMRLPCGTKEYIRILVVLQTHHQKLHHLYLYADTLKYSTPDSISSLAAREPFFSPRCV